MRRWSIHMTLLMMLLAMTGFTQAKNENTGTLLPLGAMTVPRAAHSATLLPDGRILISGGINSDEEALDSAELYDPEANTFIVTDHLNAKRSGQSATLLSDGDVLIVGGYGDGWLASAELYDPATQAFTPTGSMLVARDGFTTTLLQDGRVLITGGYNHSYRKVYASAEIYDPADASFSPTGDMTIGRAAHTATLLPDGRVLLVGGKSDNGLLSSAEIYDPASGTFSLTGSISAVRYKHAAALLPDGSVLVMGGSNERDEYGRYSSSEIYIPEEGQFMPAADMEAERYKFSDAVTLLESGAVFVAGSAKSAEIYDPVLQVFQLISGEMDTTRFSSTSTRLSNGDVLVTGGYDDAIQPTAAAWIYEPDMTSPASAASVAQTVHN